MLTPPPFFSLNRRAAQPGSASHNFHLCFCSILAVSCTLKSAKNTPKNLPFFTWGVFLVLFSTFFPPCKLLIFKGLQRKTMTFL